MNKNKHNDNINNDKPIKVTWDDIFKDFQRCYPTLSKRVVDWWPLDFAIIQIRLVDNEYMKYDYDIKHAEFIPEPKIKITSEMDKKIKERLGESDE